MNSEGLDPHSVAAPAAWNSLPSTVRSSQTLNTSWKHLKTHLFQYF